MKNKNYLLPLLICTICILSIPVTITGQIDCSLRKGGTSGNPGGFPQRYCDEPPTDIFAPQTGITCIGCQPGTAQHPPYFSHGGTKECTAYSEQVLIMFNQPVANLEWEVFGARTVTDNRGVTIHLDPPLDEDGYPTGSDVARFPGGGILSLIISNPFKKDVYSLGTPSELLHEDFWEIHSWNHSWTEGSVYQQCNCSRPPIPAPFPQTVTTNWALNADGTDPNWSMIAEISPNDGLVLRDIRLGARYMVEKVSVPYYYLDTSVSANTRGELKPNGNDITMKSRLVNYQVFSDNEKLVLEATYLIDKITETSLSCLQIVQRHEFYKSKPGDQCEPSGKLPCSRWKPIVKYEFFGQGGESLTSINIAQRQHRMVDGNPYNTVGLFKDAETIQDIALNQGLFTRTYNPLHWESFYWMAIGGRRVWDWDNIHQTMMGFIDEPGIDWTLQNWDPRRPGCPECFHSHWRWGAFAGGEGGGRLIGLPSGSNQDLDFAVVKFNPGEEDPQRYLDLINTFEKIRTWDVGSRNPLQVYLGSAPEDVVYWQSGTGYHTRDTFFGFGGFYNATLTPQQLLQPSSAGSSNAQTNSGPSGPSPADPETCVQDGISSIVASQQYSTGTTNVLAFDATLGGPLPPGYSQYSTLSYNVVTEAEISGPDTVTFCVPSVTDSEIFNNLRIFHLEQDQYNPAQLRWVDRSILAPDSPAPDFANKKISARTSTLGQFVVASLTDPQPPNTAEANISITSSDSPDQVVLGNDVTLSFTVHNSGPQNATDIVFNSALSPQLQFVSVNSTQGTCTDVEGGVVCRLGLLASGNDATVDIVVRPVEGSTPPPPQGTVVTSSGFAQAKEIDPNTSNNLVSENTTLLPDNNLAPTIEITSPGDGAIFVGPTAVALTASASDSDGSVSSVDFYENGEFIGAGTSTQPGEFTFNWTNALFGRHVVTAIAKDDLNKAKVSEPVVVIVNGSASVAVTSPANFTYFNRPSSTTLTAVASLVGGTISEVNFYVDGFRLGVGTPMGSDQYSLGWSDVPSGQHVVTAVATDSTGAMTWSAPITVIANDPAVIGIIAPAQGTVFSPSPATIPIVANVADFEGYAREVKFFANGNLIGTKTLAGINQFPFTWSNVVPGNYAITAVATDNLDAISTSPPINVRVNASPSVSITAPSSGSQYPAPAEIVLTANATDSDGTIAQVNFFANGVNIGTGTSVGGNQYSLTWSNVGFGVYAISAVATDNDGATTNVSGPTVSATTPVLFVVGSTTLNASDAAVKARIEALGHTVVVKDGASSATADATGKALVVISSTVTPTSVGTKFRTVTVPVLLWESGLFNNMGMTGSGNKDFGTKTGQTQVTIPNATHPLAAGLTGTVTVLPAAKTFDWGKPNANAISIATLAGDSAKTGIFGYEPGVAMPGLAAPARRLGLFLFDDTAETLNANGNALLDAGIRWARGGGTLSGSIAASPIGSVNLTNEGTIDWVHWGRNGANNVNRKSGVTPKITNFTWLGSGAHNWFADSPTTFTWSDGTPVLNVTNTPTGINTNGAVGNGFEITIPADTNLRTLKIYNGVWFTQGKLEVTLSDASAPAYIDTSQNNNSGATRSMYTIQFKAASSGQTLKVRFTILTQYFSPNGVVAWEAATLQ